VLIKTDRVRRTIDAKRIRIGVAAAGFTDPSLMPRTSLCARLLGGGCLALGGMALDLLATTLLSSVKNRTGGG
jgi:hypothetical protein